MVASNPIRSPVDQPAFRELPSDPDLEAMFLSSCMLDGAEVVPHAVMAGIDSPERLYDPKHAALYSVILDLYQKQKPTTIDVIATELKRRRELESLGGYGFLVQVSQRFPTTLEAKTHIEALRGYALRRAAIRSRTATIEEAYDVTTDTESFLTAAQARESAAAALQSSKNEETVEEATTALLADLDRPKSERKGVAGEISWGLVDLDRICGKLAPNSLVVLAGKASTGKSALADQCAWGAAEKGLTTVVFSYEMPKSDKIVRMAQQISRLNIDDYDTAPMDRKLAFTSALRKIKDCKALHIYERDNGLNKLIARTRLVHRKTPVKLIVIDFLQRLAKLEPRVGKERTDEALGRITTAMTDLAKECGCPVLLLSALNREGYKDTNAKPTMASLRNSGEIESDADVVMLLHWPKENPKTGQDQDPHDGMTDSFYVVAAQDKGRSKGVHDVGLMFSRKATRFDCLTR